MSVSLFFPRKIYQLDLGSCRSLKMCTFKGFMEFRTIKINLLGEIIAFY